MVRSWSNRAVLNFPISYPFLCLSVDLKSVSRPIESWKDIFQYESYIEKLISKFSHD
jgi:hypothetical protein